MRKENIKAVCTNDEARQYFADKGLTYDDITTGDILTLVILLNKHIKEANKNHETSVDSIHLSEKMDIKKNSNGTITSCYLYLNSYYFTRRECISFNTDGFIGFAGWADQGNTNPILRAFLEWCDILAGTGSSQEKKEIIEKFPCKVGDKVKLKICCGDIEIKKDWHTGTFECPFENDCIYEHCEDSNEREIKTEVLEIFTTGQVWYVKLRGVSMDISINDFGRYIFLDGAERRGI